MGRGRAKAKQVKVARQLKYSGGGMDLDQLRAEFGVGTDRRDADEHAFADRYSVDDDDDEDGDDVDDEADEADDYDVADLGGDDEADLDIIDPGGLDDDEDDLGGGGEIDLGDADTGERVQGLRR